MNRRSFLAAFGAMIGTPALLAAARPALSTAGIPPLVPLPKVPSLECTAAEVLQLFARRLASEPRTLFSSSCDFRAGDELLSIFDPTKVRLIQQIGMTVMGPPHRFDFEPVAIFLATAIRDEAERGARGLLIMEPPLPRCQMPAEYAITTDHTRQCALRMARAYDVTYGQIVTLADVMYAWEQPPRVT